MKGSPVAFCTFESHEAALSATTALAGQKFDPDGAIVIRAELAKKNSAPKRPREDGMPSSNSRPKRDTAPPQWLPPMDPYMQAGYPMGGGYPYAPPPQTMPPSVSYAPPVSKHAAAGPGGCTLFVGGIGMATETSIRALFSQTPGLKNVKVKNGEGRKGVAWIQYDNPAAAAEAQIYYQSALVESGGQPIRVEFAKSETTKPA
eukprot:CAMPEP_0119308784 /NCGR_PEP_ID=MMETSP1333-20130426/12758_1 /TAXON_ID=418940 /ORGANISM="Scyphosphaera apsteinii, Strain RCC1455" /LENGTH=202 /DNA_ID=CAMNT_0007312629 /DNA_START=182 /DNA_END=790 /DNA_ORIENTATION=+